MASTHSSTFSLSNGVFDTCAKIETPFNVSGDANVTISNITWKNTVGDSCIKIYSPYGKTAGKTRSITGCVFDKYTEFYPPVDWLITGNYFHNGFYVSDGIWNLFEANFVRVQDSINIAGSVKDCFILHDNIWDNNPHFMSAGNWGGRNYVVDGVIFEATSTTNAQDGAEGDCIMMGTSGSAVTVEVKNCIVLPGGSSPQTMSGTLVSALGNANITINVHHNTCYVGNQGILAVGETYAGHTGMVTGFDHNIAWDDAVPRGYKMYDVGTNDNISNIVLSANANYNCGHNVMAGSNLKGYNNLEFSSGSPGANDVDVNPQFIDATRDLAKWDQSLGGPGTVAHALVELQKKNDATGYNSAFNITALLTYIRGGFVPQNQALKNIGGSDIGAVAVLAATSKKRMMMMGI